MQHLLYKPIGLIFLNQDPQFSEHVSFLTVTVQYVDLSALITIIAINHPKRFMQINPLGSECVMLKWDFFIDSYCQHHLRLRLVGLSSAGYSVADACTSHRVHCLHNDKGPLLQRSHCQMPVVRHWLQVSAIPRPHGVSHLQNPHLEGPHLNELREKR